MRVDPVHSLPAQFASALVSSLHVDFLRYLVFSSSILDEDRVVVLLMLHSAFGWQF